MRTPSLNSLLLGSTDAARLRDWYATALDAAIDPDGFIDFGPVSVLMDERDDVAARTVEPGRVVLNYHVTDIKAHAAHLDALGVEWMAPVEYRDAGLWFGTVRDPDGNFVQLIETTPEYWVRKRARFGQAAGPLSSASCAPRLPAQDLGRARRFYADVLGLEPAEERDGGLRYECAGTTFVVFASAGTASGGHTQIGFTVPDVEATATMLRDRGMEWPGSGDDDLGIVDIEGHYPSSGATGERGFWFHDSEGNLLGVGQLVYG